MTGVLSITTLLGEKVRIESVNIDLILASINLHLALKKRSERAKGEREQKHNVTYI